VSEHNTSWFHCGRCGSLFLSKPGDTDERLCSKCGFDPCPGLGELSGIPQRRKPAEESDGNQYTDSSKKSAKRTTKKHKPKNSYFMVKLITGWLLLLALIIFGARMLWNQEDHEPEPTAETDSSADSTPGADTNLINESQQEYSKTLAGYLSAGNPEARNQFVLDPISTATRMVRFDSLNPLTKIDPAKIAQSERGVLNLSGETAIETHWTSEGRLFDAVFRKQDNAWRLDWDQFVRYSDYPWSLFLAGSGPDEGEFRLLARERLAEERKDEDTISIVLYAPRFGHPDETGFQSPEFIVSRNTRNGQLLDAAFKLDREGKSVFDSKLTNTNPDEMIRLRVKVQRSNSELKRTFEITEVIACHWYDLDEPGVEPAKAGEDAAPAQDN
jgi:hypothetical protein